MPAATPTACLVNGIATSQLAVQDRGLAYGDGLFETMRVVEGRLPLGDYHFARLELGALRLRMHADIPLIRAEAEQMARSAGDGVLKLILTRGLSQRGYALPTDPRFTRILLAAPAPSYPPERALDGISLFPCTTRLGLQPLLAGIKHLNRLEQVLARAEWQGDAFAEGLMRDWQGRVIECTMSNIFVHLDGAWVTPSLDESGVQGVMRDFLIDRLAAGGLRVVQRDLSLEELHASSEVFCCNSMFGVWPVVALENKRWGVGAQTRAVQAIAAQVFT
jgi:4-amino-4-deoxychorismate lyase